MEYTMPQSAGNKASLGSETHARSVTKELTQPWTKTGSGSIQCSSAERWQLKGAMPLEVNPC